jgi:hypothetical protein
MIVKKEKVREEFHRDLFWTRILIISDEGLKKTQILTCASQEYLEDYYRLSGGQKLEKVHFDEWLNRVVKKWEKLGEEIFNQEIHYDVYTNTEKGEANGTDFLLQIKK